MDPYELLDRLNMFASHQENNIRKDAEKFLENRLVSSEETIGTKVRLVIEKQTCYDVVDTENKKYYIRTEGGDWYLNTGDDLVSLTIEEEKELEILFQNDGKIRYSVIDLLGDFALKQLEKYE